MTTNYLPVAPNSVHVWRGYKSVEKTYDEFADFLGSVFVPACALLQPGAGLHAYLASMPAQKNKPAFVPDQTALMFWTTPETYHDGFNKVAVRAYTNLHGDAYAPESRAEFPDLFDKKITLEQPYFLLNQKADWMQGHVAHLIASPGKKQTSSAFIDRIEQWATSLQSNVPKDLQGGLFCAGKDYLVAWLLWNQASNLQSGEDPYLDLIPDMQVWLHNSAEKYIMPATLWDDWPGINLQAKDYSCLNIQLERNKG